jgi:hypothetical protein
MFIKLDITNLDLYVIGSGGGVHDRDQVKRGVSARVWSAGKNAS